MTAPAVFDYGTQQVRTVVIDGEPWFVATDVCAVLGIANGRDALSRVDADGVGSTDVIDSMGRTQTARTVSEPALYELIFQSRRPEARDFRRWVTGTVLPQIRRTGSYSTTAELTGPELLARAVIEAQQMIEAKDARIAELEPAAEVASKLLDADGDMSVGDTAKALTRAGIKTGPQRLFALLDTYGWICRAPGDGRWRVKQSAIEAGVMSVIPQSHYHPKTGVLVLDAPQPRVTPKGLQRLLRDHGASAAA